MKPEIFKKRVKIPYGEFKERDGIVSFEVYQDFAIRANLKFKMSPQLLYLLGFTPTLQQAIEWRSMKNKPPFKGKYFANLTRMTLSALWVFADIVEDNNINNTLHQLLRVVPIEVGSRPASYCIFGNLHNIKLNQSNISRIRIWFKEDPNSDKNLHINGEIFIRLQFQ